MPCPLNQPGCNGPEGSGKMCMFCRTHAPKTSGGGPPTPPLPPFKNVSGPPTLPPLGKGVPLGKGLPLPKPVVHLKPVVPLPVPDEILSTEPSGGRSVVLYRGDSREPGEIKRFGFELWGEAIAKVTKEGGIANYIANMCRKCVNGKTVADFVRGSKNTARPTVSTSLDEGCGGYTTGYIFKIEVSGLQEYDLDERIMPESAKGMKWSSDGLKVFMNGTTLQTSRLIVIDLKLATKEWAFFTKVPSDRITAYRKGKEAFKPMSGVEVIIKKWW
jgi:hypothetical protein